MAFFPDRQDFAGPYNAGKAQVVYRQVLGDTETTISALMKIGAERPYTSLFESVEGGATLARYSFIAIQPDLIWKRQGDETLICTDVAQGVFTPENSPLSPSAPPTWPIRSTAWRGCTARRKLICPIICPLWRRA